MFERENQYYQANKEELLKHHSNKYALIKGDSLYGIFDTEKRAFEKGVEKFGLEPFMIKLILDKDESIKIPTYTLGLIHAHH